MKPYPGSSGGFVSPDLRSGGGGAYSKGYGDFGDRGDYTQRLCKDLERLLGHFQNNLDLLIQKTRIDKADAVRKEKLQDRVAGFIAEIEREDYRMALKEFSAILRGCQSPFALQ
jgi:hypothetical protein